MQVSWSKLSVGTRVGVGNFAEVLQGKYQGGNVAVKKFMKQEMSSKVTCQLDARRVVIPH